jgi:hypothetical protein
MVTTIMFDNGEAMQHAEGSHIVIYHLLGSLKQHLEGCQFHNNEEEEMVVLNGLEQKTHFV